MFFGTYTSVEIRVCGEILSEENKSKTQFEEFSDSVHGDKVFFPKTFIKY